MKKTPFVLVFTSLLSKFYERKHLYLLQIFKIHIFHIIHIFCSFMFLHLLLLKWQPFQYNSKTEEKAPFIVVFTMLMSKTFWKNYPKKSTFFNLICKVYVICTKLQTFRIWIFTVLKSRPFQCNRKFESKIPFIVVLKWLLSKIFCKDCLCLYKFSTFILRRTI